MEEIKNNQLLKDRNMSAYEGDVRSITDLLIDQVEFADTLIVNKCDLISKPELQKIQGLLKHLNPTARHLSSVRAKLDLSEIIHTGRFCPEKAAEFQGFATELISPHTSETEEFGIGSFVFTSPLPFHPGRLHRLFFGDIEEEEDEANGEAMEEDDNEDDGEEDEEDEDGEAMEEEGKEEEEDEEDEKMRMVDDSIMLKAYRSKGFFYLATYFDAKLNWSTAGRFVQFDMIETWRSSMLPEELWPETDESWHSVFGDRTQQIVIIGDAQHLPAIRSALEDCLLTPSELEQDRSTWSKMDPHDIWNLGDF